LCVENSNCSWYTYFYDSDIQFHEDCALLAELLPPLQDCEHCVTGVPNCIGQQCDLEMNGEVSQSLMVTNTSESQSITVSGVATVESCELRILAVGGGGGYGGSYHGGGAGSGYLQYRTIIVNPGTIVTLDVGDHEEPSTVAFGNGYTVTAQPGQDSQGDDGGDGYSGTCHGGSDGGDGDDGMYVGGSGTGEDISLYVFDAWTLSPGAGGKPYNTVDGGGGGGVLVDGAGPEADVYQGQGYGGGLGGGWYSGLQGIILIETTSVGRRR